MLVHSKDNTDHDPEGIEKDEKAYVASKKLLPHLFEGSADDVLYEPQKQNKNEVDNLQTEKGDNHLPLTFISQQNSNGNSVDYGGIESTQINDDYLKNYKMPFSSDENKDKNSHMVQNDLGLFDGIKDFVHDVAMPIKRFAGSRYVKEGLFALNNPLKSIITGPYIDNAPNISTTVARFAGAGNILDKNANSTDEASEKGAMRHALWQAVLSVFWGNNIAERIGNAHEDGLGYDVGMRRYNNLNAADRTVDLLNNIEGRRIAKKYKSINPKKMALCVLNEFRMNGLYVAVRAADGYWYIERRRLSEDKYNAMINEFREMNFLGYR